ncbi:hypothetical protein CBR_g30936 [Chara braunii]|uniref:HAT C-terminal dimerisation domain-containing protein n=1 Tax=Chara braunii TaxID=69332 RepID=A0A388LDU3_CHABU|nr:hypothetical protein CBR_g30936 [Chara braunii]|eukprot:GBG80474.1 hypothetical protein CBR_g30936 [Chara braunii]
MASTSRRRGPAAYPPFEPLPYWKQEDLKRSHAVWQWVVKGQEWGVVGGGNFLIRSRLCDELFPGSRSRAVDHFTKTKAHCPRRTTEILWRLQRHGAQLWDAMLRRLAAEYADAMEEELAVEDLVGRGTAAPAAPADASATQTRTDGGEDGRGAAGPDGGQQDCLARDAADDVRERLRALVGMGDGGDERAARGTPTTSTASTQVALQGRQTTLDPFLRNKVQNDLHRLLALAMYSGGMSFNWLRLKETQKYWDYIVTLLRPSVVPAPRLLSYEGVRTRMMDIIYHEVAALIAPKKAKWKDTGCTLMTDGATDQRNKPIMNFIAVGQSWPILIRTIDVSARDKTGPTHAAAYLLDPRRRDISLLSDRNSPVMQSTLDHFSRMLGGGWESKALGDLWEDLWTFHCDDPWYWPVDGPHWWDEVVVRDAASKTMHPALWWQLHGGGHPRLQAIAKKVLGMWSTASPCERNWATHDFIHTKRRNNLSATSVEKLVFIHWNMQLLGASRRPESRYIDVWADIVKDPPEEVDDGDVLPVDADEEEWEAAARANRHKDGRDRITSASRYVGDHYEPGPWADAVWMHREMAEHMQQERDKGKTLAEDQHDVLDDWAGLDPHEDLDAYVGGSFRTVKTLRERVGGQTDVEGLLAREDAERDRNRSYDDVHGSTPVRQARATGSTQGSASQTHDRAESSHQGARVIGNTTIVEAHACAGTTSDSATDHVRRSEGSQSAGAQHGSEQRAEQRTEQRVHQASDQSVVDRPQQRMEDTNTVEQVAEQVADHPRVTQTVVQTVHQRVDCAVDDTVQERREEGAQFTVEPRVGDAVTPTVEQRAEQRLGDRVEALLEQRTEQRAHMSRDCRVEQRAKQRLDVRVDVCVDQRLGHERVVERVGESVLHDVGGVMAEERTKERGRVNPQESVTPETTLSRGSFYGIPPLPPRGAQSSIRVDVGAHVGEPPQRQREGEIASSGGRGALDTVSSHERQGGIHSSILTSHVDTETPDVSKRLPTGRGIVSGVCTRSQAGDGERRKVSSRVLDDDPDHNDDGSTSDEMSGSDYAEEARLRGGDFGGDGDGSHKSHNTEDDVE